MLYNFSHFKIKSKLQEELSSLGYDVYEKYKEEPNLPIHLYCEKYKGRETEELLLFQILTTGEISEDLIKRLHCYQLMIHPAVKTFLIISPEIEYNDYFKSLLESGGIGLWKIKKDYSFEKDVVDGKSIRQRIIDEFKTACFDKEVGDPPKKASIHKFSLNEKDVSDICLAAGKSTDLIFTECMKLILEDPPTNIGQSNLDVNCMKLLSELNKIRFADEIKSISEEYFSDNPDDYEFSLKWTRNLWKIYLNFSYPDIHKDMDPILQILYPEYREHFLHQFQVFLLGLIIIEKLIEEKILAGEMAENIQLSWLLASTFHDFAYSLQLYNKWTSDFFIKFLKIDKSKKIGLLEMDRIYIEESFSSNIEYIIAKLYESIDNKDKNHTDSLNKLRLFFYGMISENMDHGLLSSMSLLKISKENGVLTSDNKFKNIILPASFAIAIHNDKIWKILHGKYEEKKYRNEKENKMGKWVKGAAELKCLHSLHYDKYPVAFLLILCDSIQEWGRTQKCKEVKAELEEANIQIINVKIESKIVTISLLANRTRGSLKFLTNKLEELKDIEKYMKSPNLPFNIRFYNRKDNKEMEELHIEINGE